MLNRYTTFGTVLTRNGKQYMSGVYNPDLLYQGRNKSTQGGQGLTFHQVASNEDNRLDLLAYIYPALADPYMYCYVAWMNQIFDPLADVPVNKTIVMPVFGISPSDVKAVTYAGS